MLMIGIYLCTRDAIPMNVQRMLCCTSQHAKGVLCVLASSGKYAMGDANEQVNLFNRTVVRAHRSHPRRLCLDMFSQVSLLEWMVIALRVKT
jgi:hypothetical protein